MTIERGACNAMQLSISNAGAVFEYKNDLFIITDEEHENTITCIRLCDGHVEWFKKDMFVNRRRAKVVLGEW